jgi:uncharacterized protein (TIGR04255 family)
VAARYKSPPITEAVYEFAPTTVPKWYEATPRQIVAAIGDSYPVRDEAKAGSASFQLGPDGFSTTQQASVTRTRIWRADRSRMFQFGRDLCAFNALKPYTSYANYVPEMQPLVEEYANRTRPTGVFFLGQRYLNLILLPDTAADPAEYFDVYPRLTRRHRPFAMHLQVGEVVQGTTVLSLIFQGLDAGTRPIYLLDLYVRTHENPDIPFQWPEMRAWQDNAHQAIIEAFEGAITDKCRNLLGLEEGT